MSEAYLGEVRAFGFGFAPAGWLQCNGQLLPIAANTALFSILGTSFGGDGRVTFGLPNFQANVPIGAGAAVTGTNYPVGGTGGQSLVMLTAASTPPHTHQLLGAGARYPADGNTPGPTQSLAPATGCTPYVPPANNPTTTSMDPKALSPFGVGANGPHNNLMPSLTLNLCICVNGLFPPRS